MIAIPNKGNKQGEGGGGEGAVKGSESRGSAGTHHGGGRVDNIKDESYNIADVDEYDAEVDEEWTDHTQYFPTILAVGHDEISGHESKVRDVLAATGAGQYLVMQLPSKLSLGRPRKADPEAASEGGTAMDVDATGPSPQPQVTELSHLDEGELGELCVHKDGTVKLHLGEAVFDVMHGTEFRHSEQLACVDTSGSKCAFLGDVPGRLVCIPDVLHMLK